ncbi:MAG: response regulator [Pseudomonadota bacterium]
MDISQLSIVVVEPSHAQWRIISGHLRDQGVTDLHWFKQGDETLQGIAHLRPDLVISGMYLPDMTGSDLVYAIRREPRFEDVMFMLISTETDEYRLEPIRQAGVIAILPKPFDPRDMKRALMTAADFADPHSEPEDVDMAELRVLVVDDSDISRAMVVRLLHKIGIEEIVQAENGAQAVELLARTNFDLVITDYNMPEMDGRELVRYIRHSPDHRALPVLMITAEHDEEILAAVYKEGVSAICDKPFDSIYMKDIIKRALRE